jgi:hypothetical protein
VIGIIRTEDLENLSKNGLALAEDNQEIDRTGVPLEVNIAELLDSFSSKRAVMVMPTDSSNGPLGLLTISDLNKPPLRHFLYLRLFELETRLADFIVKKYNDPWDWIRYLSESGQVLVLGNWELAKKQNVQLDIGPIHACTLTNLISIVERDRTLQSELGYTAIKNVEKELRLLSELRNKVMHPIRPLVLGQDDICKLRITWNYIELALNRLTRS